MKNLRTAFGTHTQARRKALSLTQAQLADKVDLSVDTIGQIERGKIAPSFETIEALTEALGIHASELFGGLPLVPSKRHQPLVKIVERLREATPAELKRIGSILDSFFDE
ncbi:MAG: helix-turn-helix transcriptional regulator [Terricaulis sp.]